MIAGFQCFSDINGNLWVADGYVAQLRNGVRLPVGAGEDLPPLLRVPDGSRYVPLEAATGGTFIGGSGRNLVLSGLSPSASGPEIPVGLFTPGRPGFWHRGIFTLTMIDASTALIDDGSDTVATLSVGGIAPDADYDSEIYGETTYNSGAAFTLVAALEEDAPGTIPGQVLSVSAGTAQAGDFSAVDAANYESDDDSDWTIVVASDGSAEYQYLGVAMAERAEGSPYEPGGVYEATAAGIAAYGASEAWRAFVQTAPVATRAGFVYLALTETAGVLTAVEGPFFATSLPSDTATVFNIPLVQSDGLGTLAQLHTGLLIWDRSFSTIIYDSPGSSGSIALPAGAKAVEIRMFGGGGGGGSGRRGAAGTVRCGGGGGAASGMIYLPPTPVGRLSFPLAFVIGSGGSGGSAQSVDDSDGNDGVAGISTTMGNFTARGGNSGKKGTATTGTGGAGAGTTVVSIGLSAAATSTAGGSADASGGTGGSSVTGANAQPGGGGAGGGLSVANARGAGGVGGYMGAAVAYFIAGGTTGGGGGNQDPVTLIGTGGGGGTAVITTLVGQAGGNGASYGGGGGGGSSSVNGQLSGGGGNGGGGAIVVTFFH